MEKFLSPFALFLIGSICSGLLAVALPFALWYYFRAKEIAPLLAIKESLGTELENLRRDIHSARESLDALSEETVKARDLIKQGELAKAWLENTKKEIEDVSAQKARMNAEYEGAKGQLDELQKKVSDKQLELAELNKKLESISGKIDESQKQLTTLPDRYRVMRGQLEKELDDLRVEKSALATEIATLKAERENLPREVDALKKTLKELMAQESDLRELLNKLNQEVFAAKGEVERLSKARESLKNEIDKLKEMRSKTSTEVAELEGRRDEAKRWIEHKRAMQEDADDKWKNLNLPVFDEKRLAETRKFEDGKEDEWLSDFEEALADNGFVFNPRAIRAFHTGLKCAGSTPLVVLAGISGTGKSLLPELYSAAMGMNFLPIPVQPRWDSPQDLFGFYNYMEQRYKATELSRLLWQYDIYNNPQVQGLTLDRLPMNVVLLDEMNLARVEYYFSDLLSKLEMRNGLDEKNADDRLKAEISLECNAAENIDATRKLFVSPHTLFVGTMNEDESTQTLSDKVIDRANVLRFGRPANLDAKPEKSKFLSLYRSRTRISAKHWDSWCRKLADGEESKELKFLRETLIPVVAALDTVNRPYGFRVDNAMKTYVLNYPGSHKEAVADQIEMKVLPKLNGLELDSDGFPTVKRALQDAIGKTGDKDLADAFEKSCPPGGAFFKWRGVMR